MWLVMMARSENSMGDVEAVVGKFRDGGQTGRIGYLKHPARQIDKAIALHLADDPIEMDAA